MPLITLGDSTKLQVKVPSKGDTNWESDFKTEFAQKIVDHDHTGVDGKGVKIAEAAIEDGAITTAKIADGAVTSVKIAADAVADIDLAPNSVGTSELKDANVTTAKIADANVTTAKIADANVTAAKIGSDVVLSTLNNVSSTSPTSGQVLKWSGSEWAPAEDLAGSAGTLVTISSQSDANSYSNSAGDTVVIDAAEDVSFSNPINDSSIYITGNDNVEFASLSGCTVKGGTGTITCKTMYQTNLSTPGTFIFKNSSSPVSMLDSLLICNTFNFLISDTSTLTIGRSHVRAYNVGYSGGSGSNKVLMSLGSVLECASYGVLNSVMDIRLHTTSKLIVKNTFHGKVIDSAGTGTILDRSTSDVIAHPFTIIDNIVQLDVPVAGRYNISSNVTVDTSSSDTYDVQWDTVDQQTGGLSLSNNKIKIPYDGWYQITAGVYVTNLDNSNDDAGIRWRISVNGSSRVYNHETQVTSSLTMVQDSASLLYYCEKDELIGVYIQEISDGDNSIIVNSAIDATFLSIHKVK